MTAIQGQTSTRELRFLRCDDDGKLTIDTTGGDGGATADNQTTIIANQTNGTQLARAMGSEDPTDPAATQRQLHVDGTGNLLVKETGTVNVAPANTANSGITDSPANSLAVGLKARQDKALASSETFLVCDSQGHLQIDLLNQNVEAQLAAFTDITNVGSVKRLLCDNDGHLQVDIVSGGGGGSAPTNTYDSISMTSNTTNAAPVNSSYIDLTNARNIQVSVVASSSPDLRSDLSVALEFTDDNTATTCFSGITAPSTFSQTFGILGATGFDVALLDVGDNEFASQSIRGKFARIVLMNNNVTLNNTAYSVDAKVVLTAA